MNAVVVSLDVELGWGFHDREEMPAGRLRTARRNWGRLLDLFDEYGMPATWALVGHLLLAECEREHVDHPAGPRCCTRSVGEPDEDVWTADGLVDAIEGGVVDHEIASHGFTHVHFNHERMSRPFAARELAAARAASAERGYVPDSFVFPVNEVDHRDLLAAHDFSCYRGRRPSRPGRATKLLDALLDRGTPPIVQPTVDEHGLVNVPASLNLFAFEGVARSLVGPVRGDPVTNRVRRGIDRLADTDGVLHLWFHPHDLTRQRKFDRLRAVLEAIAAARDDGHIQVETMGGVAERVRDRSATDRSAGGDGRPAAQRTDAPGPQHE